MSDEKQKGIFAPDNYRDLCNPFPDGNAAEAALQAFWDEVYEIRNKHRMTDVHIVVRVPIADHHVMTSFHMGDSMLSEAMTAYAFGLAQAQRQETIARVAEDAINAIRKKKNRP